MVDTTKSLGKVWNNQINILDTTMNSFEKIINAFWQMTPEIEAVNASAYELDGEKNSILVRIEDVASIAEEVSASSEEIAAFAEEMNASMDEIASAAKTLTGMTKEMQEQIRRFKISEAVNAVDMKPDITEDEAALERTRE